MVKFYEINLTPWSKSLVKMGSMGEDVLIKASFKISHPPSNIKKLSKNEVR